MGQRLAGQQDQGPRYHNRRSGKVTSPRVFLAATYHGLVHSLTMHPPVIDAIFEPAISQNRWRLFPASFFSRICTPTEDQSRILSEWSQPQYTAFSLGPTGKQPAATGALHVDQRCLQRNMRAMWLLLTCFTRADPLREMTAMSEVGSFRGSTMSPPRVPTTWGEEQTKRE
jgi:hypothetical protein